MSDYKFRNPDYVDCFMADMEKDISKYEIFLPRTSQYAENSNTSEIPV